MATKLVYGIKDRPQIPKLIVFALQQLLAIMAATITVPMIVGNGMSTSAALFGAGIGTLVYQLFTRFRSPVFLGSSFAFIGPMQAAFPAAYACCKLGYLGLLVGAASAALVYVILALIVKLAGVNWINKLMPAVVIGPTVALIGLSLAGSAINNIFTDGDRVDFGVSSYIDMTPRLWVTFACALVTFAVVVVCSVYGKKMLKLIPFILGIAAGYLVALVLTVVGIYTNNEALQVISFEPFKNLVADKVTLSTFLSVPDFTFLEAAKDANLFNWSYAASVVIAFVPVAFVVFAEHLADHKNLSTIIGQDLIKDPGLHRTLLGDGVGSVAGSIFGGCPNTTYGESVGCVAITGNASVITITVTAFAAMAISFISPFVAFLNSIPACVMGGVCIALYGFIAVSGLKMIQKVDLEDNANLFTVAAILIPGIGGMALALEETVYITTIACALILGIVTNVALTKFKKNNHKNEEETEA